MRTDHHERPGPEHADPAGATYVWHGAADLSQSQVDPNIQNDIVHQRIQNAINAQMKAKGFVLTTDSAAAYFAVRYYMALQKSTELVTTTTGVGYGGGYYGGYGYGWGWGGYGGGISTTTPVTSTDGGVVIDLLQNSSGKLVWRGQVTGQVRQQRAQRAAGEPGDCRSDGDPQAGRVQEEVVAGLFGGGPDAVGSPGRLLFPGRVPRGGQPAGDGGESTTLDAGERS